MDKAKEAFSNFVKSIHRLNEDEIEKKKIIKSLLEQKPIDIVELKKHCVSQYFQRYPDEFLLDIQVFNDFLPLDHEIWTCRQ